MRLFTPHSGGAVRTILILAMSKLTQVHQHHSNLKNPPFFPGGFFVWKHSTFLFFVGLLFPTALHAQIIFSEIMYDTLGADNNEWIEIYNTSKTDVDLKEWKLFENNTNHSFKVIRGTSVLSSETHAIIVNDSKLFLKEYPNVGGALFDSVFSLSNEGETLELRKGEEVKEVVTYNSGQGAKGDGHSLQKIDTSFIASVPTPGRINMVNNLKLIKELSPSTKPAQSMKKVTTKKESLPKTQSAVSASKIAVSQIIEEVKEGTNVFVVKKQISAWEKLKQYFIHLF